jgi:hypothetical protein
MLLLVEILLAYMIGTLFFLDSVIFNTCEYVCKFVMCRVQIPLLNICAREIREKTSLNCDIWGWVASRDCQMRLEIFAVIPILNY